MRHSNTAFVSLLLAFMSFTPLSAQAEDVSTPPLAVIETPVLPPDYPQTLLDAVLESEELAKALAGLVKHVDEKGGAKNAYVSEADYDANLNLHKTVETAIASSEAELQRLAAFEALPIAETFDAQMNHWRLEENLRKIRILLPELERLCIRLYQVGTI